LHPNDEACARVVGVLARGHQLYREHIRIHFGGGTSNHLHLIISSRHSVARALFKCYIATNLSKELGDLFEWRERLFGRPTREIAVADHDALIERLQYCAQHGIKEGLVSPAEGWVGIPWVRSVADGVPLTGVWYDRTRLSRLRWMWRRRRADRRGPEPTLDEVASRMALELDPIPTHEGLSPESRRAAWAIILAGAEERFPPPNPDGSALGGDKVLAQHPHTRPARTKKSPAPTVHARSAESFAAWQTAYVAFAAAYRAAWLNLRDKVGATPCGLGFPAGGVAPGAAVELPKTDTG
jgi:hypothetical protein